MLQCGHRFVLALSELSCTSFSLGTRPNFGCFLLSSQPLLSSCTGAGRGGIAFLSDRTWVGFGGPVSHGNWRRKQDHTVEGRVAIFVSASQNLPAP